MTWKIYDVYHRMFGFSNKRVTKIRGTAQPAILILILISDEITKI